MSESEARILASGVSRASATDADAFAAAVRPSLDGLLRTAGAILGDEAEARDALQDALSDAWRGFPRLRDPDRVEAWLARIVLNRCRMALRTRSRRPIRHVGAKDPADWTEREQAPARDFAEALADRDVMDRAFEHLGPDHRIVLVLHYLEDRPLREIAELLGIAEGTVKSRLHAARSSMAAALARELR